MLPWIIGHDLMRANEEEIVRANRYAHHRPRTNRRSGPFLASLLRALMSRVPVPRHVHAAPEDLAPIAPNPPCSTVVDLGSYDTRGALDAEIPPSRSA
jgi:hypothetical protein